VISVAALNSADEKASFSCYDESVDVSAPGDDILSTVPNETYDFMSGTSMASPVVSGIAVLTRIAHPEMSSEQIGELIRATCDNIYGINPDYKGLLGNGRVNALRAVSEQNVKSLRLISYRVEDENGDGILDNGEYVKIYTSYKNILIPVRKVRVKAFSDSYLPLPLEKDSLYLGDLGTNDTVVANDYISFHIPNALINDYIFKIKFDISDSDDVIRTETITLFANPSYRNLNSNNITTTLNSRGNIGFNDYAFNMQGVGFKYKGSQNINFEGGLMIGTGYSHLSNCVRGKHQNYQDRDFLPFKVLTLQSPGGKATLEATAEFADARNSTQASVYVLQHAYQFTDDDARDIIFITYDIANQTFYYRDSVFAGLFFDWDIGAGGTNNKVQFDYDNMFGIVRNVKNSTLPLAGVKIITPQPVNFYAIDNGGNTKDSSIGIYNGFSKREKWMTLSNGIKRPESEVTDVSMVISAGPMRMLPLDTVRVTFALFAAKNLEQLKETAKKAQLVATRYGLSDFYYKEAPEYNIISNVYPNPSENGEISIDYVIVKSGIVSFDFYDLSSKKYSMSINDIFKTEGRYSLTLNTKDFSSGMYLLVMNAAGQKSSEFIYIEN
jgi:hypothetical protein